MSGEFNSDQYLSTTFIDYFYKKLKKIRFVNYTYSDLQNKHIKKCTLNNK